MWNLENLHLRFQQIYRMFQIDTLALLNKFIFNMKTSYYRSIELIIAFKLQNILNFKNLRKILNITKNNYYMSYF